MKKILFTTLIVLSSACLASNDEIYTISSIPECNRGELDSIVSVQVNGSQRTAVCLEGVDEKYHWVLFSENRLSYINSPKISKKANRVIEQFNDQLKKIDSDTMKEMLERESKEDQKPKDKLKEDTKYEV